MMTVSQHDCMLPSCGLRARIFYPCEASASKRAQFLPTSNAFWSNENVYALAEYMQLPSLSVPALNLALSIELPWAADAQPAARSLPLVLFSHGLGGTLSAYGTVCHDLAATGRVVVAVEHADGSAQVAFVGEERRRVSYERLKDGSSSDEEFALRHMQLRQRVDELRQVLDDISKISAGTARQLPLDQAVNLQGIIDPNAPIVVAGHSFGASTALLYAVSAVDVQVSTVIALDAWLWPMGPLQITSADVLDKRVLFVDQEHGGMSTSIQLRRSLPKPSGRGSYSCIAVKGGGHYNSCDYASRIPRFLAVRFGITAADSDPDNLMETQNMAIVEFLEKDRWEKYLYGLDNGAVSGVTRSTMPDAVR